MFASNGEITAPCGVPTLVSDHCPSSDTPAFSHFWINRSILESAIRRSTNSTSFSWLMLSKKPRMSASKIQFTLFITIPAVRASSASCAPRPGRKTIREPEKVLFINLCENRYHSLLHDLVFQCRDSQWPLPAIRFRDVDTP